MGFIWNTMVGFFIECCEEDFTEIKNGISKES